MNILGKSLSKSRSKTEKIRVKETGDQQSLHVQESRVLACGKGREHMLGFASG